jgi:predicted phosphodiesterase
MRIALVSDIHGNRWALAAVLEDIERRRVDAIWNLGDILSGPLEPAATADLLAPLALPTVAGNHERGLLGQAELPRISSDQHAYDHTEPRHRDWVASLPATLAPRADVLLCHGTPRSDLEPMLETIELDGPRPATLGEIERRAAGSTARLIACGHSHVPRVMRTSGGCVIVNPGSVGLQAYDDPHPLASPDVYYVETGSPHASYAIVEDADPAWAVNFHRVAYDWEAAAACAARNHRPDWAYALRTGFALRA